jgi:DNA-binding CsgD family transcriptional regulator
VASNPVLVSMPRASSSVTVEAKTGLPAATSFRADASERQQGNLRSIDGGRKYACTRTPRLTPREIEVVQLPHLDNEGVALVLGCAPTTSKVHRRHINGKLGSEDRWTAYMTWCELTGEGQMERAA